MKKYYTSLLFFPILAIAFFSYSIFIKNISAESDGSVTITVQISVCGNDVKEGGEQCDNDDFGSGTCSAG